MDFDRSVNVTGYYKGFKIQATQRDPEVSLKPLIENAQKAVDWMVKQGFKPSWNPDTNEVTDTSSDAIEDTAMCEIHDVPMKAREGKYGTFFSHAKKQGDKWIYCNGKGFDK